MNYLIPNSFFKAENQTIFDTIFSKIIVQSSINNDAAKMIEKCFRKAFEKGIVPSFKENCEKTLEIAKSYEICNNCDTIIAQKTCTVCKINTKTNHFLMFDIETQITRVLAAHASEMMHFDLAENGYGPDSYMMNVKNRSNLILTLTLNTDGVCLYRTKTNDTWPFFLVFNELPIKKKFAVENVILLGIWNGQRKISNKVIMNDMMRYLGQVEQKEFLVNDQNFQLKTVYGSFDKPASAMILNASNFNAKYGCRFCLRKRKTVNRRPVFKKVSKKRTDAYQKAKGIISEQKRKPVKGLKGISCLR